MIADGTRLKLNKVQGLITLPESDRLAELAKAAPAWSSVVEIGAHTGRSTLWLAAGAKEGSHAHVTTVDPWPEPGYTADEDADDDPFDLKTGEAVLERFCANLTEAQAWPQISALRAPSLKVAAMWVNPIGVLFVDSTKGYHDVFADASAWLPKVTVGGVAAFHDWFADEGYSAESQVADAVHDVVRGNEEWVHESQVDNLAIWRRS